MRMKTLRLRTPKVRKKMKLRYQSKKRIKTKKKKRSE
jgi:hypothetical protein